MRKFIKQITFLIVIILILSMTACNVNTGGSAIDRWIDSRLEAIQSCDTEAYMQTVNSDNYYLYNEEFNLISSLDIKELSAISIAATEVEDDSETAVYDISQEYEYLGQDYKCSYKAQFVKIDNKLYYNGVEAETMESGGVTVYYPGGYSKSAQDCIDAVNYYLGRLNDVYEYSPDPAICIKIYRDQDVFLQSVKFDLPKWVGGWHEYGESVKICAPNKNTAINPVTIYHECSHRFMSELTNDNASYWLQEGFATLMETAIPEGLANFDFLYNNDIENLNNSNNLWSFEDFAGVNLEELSDPIQVFGYYSLSALCVKYIIDVVGIDKFLAALPEMAQNPQIHLTAADKIDITNDLTVKCMSELLKTTEEGFYLLMDGFIDTYR